MPRTLILEGPRQLRLVEQPTAQRHAGSRRPLAHGLARSAYGALLVQGLVLIALALALRPLVMPAEVKPWPSPPPVLPA